MQFQRGYYFTPIKYTLGKNIAHKLVKKLTTFVVKRFPSSLSNDFLRLNEFK